VTKPEHGKGAEEEKLKPKKPPGYRNFRKLLKKVVNAPPFRRASKKNPEH